MAVYSLSGKRILTDVLLPSECDILQFEKRCQRRGLSQRADSSIWPRPMALGRPLHPVDYRFRKDEGGSSKSIAIPRGINPCQLRGAILDERLTPSPKTPHRVRVFLTFPLKSPQETLCSYTPKPPKNPHSYTKLLSPVPDLPTIQQITSHVFLRYMSIVSETNRSRFSFLSTHLTKFRGSVRSVLRFASSVMCVGAP